MNLVNVGELFNLIGDFTRNRIWAKSIFRQVVIGLYGLHSCGVSHRDISLENVLLHRDSLSNEENNLIIDFGLCHKISVSK